MCLIIFSRANFVADSIFNHTDIIRFMKRFPFPFNTRRCALTAYAQIVTTLPAVVQTDLKSVTQRRSVCFTLCMCHTVMLSL